MITTIIISILAVWTVFGVWAAFAYAYSNHRSNQFNVKHFILFGPVLGGGLLIIAGFSLIVDNLVAWANKE